MRLTCKVFNFVHWIFHSKYFVLQFDPSFSIQSLDWRSLTSSEFERRLRSKYLVRSWSLCRCMSTTTTAEPRGSLTPMNIDVLLFMLICSGVLSRRKVLRTNNYWYWTTAIWLSPRKFILTCKGLSINDVTQIWRQFIWEHLTSFSGIRFCFIPSLLAWPGPPFLTINAYKK